MIRLPMALALLTLTWPGARAERPAVDPLAFFQPEVELSRKDLQTLQKGDSIVRLLPGHGKEVAVFTAMPVNADADRLVAWLRRIAQLRKSSYVLAIGRFSSPPRIDDLAALSLDDDDLNGIAKCEPGDCGLKLTAPEMHRLQAAIKGKPPGWKTTLQDEFRRVVLERVETYLAGGLTAMAPYEDKSKPTARAASFSAILKDSISITGRLPDFAGYLDNYPRTSSPGVESFLYWSKDRLGGKAQVSVTHVAIVRSADPALPEVLSAGKQVFATHYVNGSLGLTAMVRDQATGQRYLAYLTRSELDVIGGLFGGFARLIIEHRLKGEAPAVLRGLRERIESGEPLRHLQLETENCELKTLDCRVRS